jgi:hypothetical protein
MNAFVSDIGEPPAQDAFLIGVLCTLTDLVTFKPLLTRRAIATPAAKSQQLVFFKKVLMG